MTREEAVAALLVAAEAPAESFPGAFIEVLTTYTQEVERAALEARLWSCPKCAFAFDRQHANELDGGYSCPNCNEAAVHQAMSDIAETIASYLEKARKRKRIPERGGSGPSAPPR